MKKKKHLLDFLLKSDPKNYARNTRQTIAPRNNQPVPESGGSPLKQKDQWMAHYRSLKKYKKQFGNCLVPANWSEDKNLAAWVRYQRHRAASLPNEKYLLLDKLGFAWDHAHCKWMEYYLQLSAYQKTNGHCNPPDTLPQFRALTRWVVRQRKLRRSGSEALKPEYFHLLDTIGFDWEYRKKTKKSPKRGLE